MGILKKNLEKLKKELYNCMYLDKRFNLHVDLKPLIIHSNLKLYGYDVQRNKIYLETNKTELLIDCIIDVCFEDNDGIKSYQIVTENDKSDIFLDFIYNNDEILRGVK